MRESFELTRAEHFTCGTVGEPGQRVFFIQARQGRRLVTLKSEKEQVRALGEYLGELLVDAERMQRGAVVVELFLLGGALLVLGLAQRRDPVLPAGG